MISYTIHLKVTNINLDYIIYLILLDFIRNVKQYLNGGYLYFSKKKKKKENVSVLFLRTDIPFLCNVCIRATVSFHWDSDYPFSLYSLLITDPRRTLEIEIEAVTMAFEIPLDQIKQLRIVLRKEANLSWYEPDKEDQFTFPKLPSVAETIANLDPSPPYLRCKDCKGRLLRGLQSYICVFCGSNPRKDLPPDPIKFTNTIGYRWLLQSLGIDGSVISNLSVFYIPFFPLHLLFQTRILVSILPLNLCKSVSLDAGLWVELGWW